MTLITVQDGKIVLRDGNVGTEEGCCCCRSVCLSIGWSLTWINDEALEGDPPNLVSYFFSGSTHLWIPRNYGAIDAPEVVRKSIDAVCDYTPQGGGSCTCTEAEIQGFFVTGDIADVSYTVCPPERGGCYALSLGFYEAMYGGQFGPVFFGLNGPEECNSLQLGVNQVTNVPVPGSFGRAVLTGQITLTEEPAESDEECFCNPCVSQDTCWLIEFDLEFLSSNWWRFGGMGQQWLPLQSAQVLWVDVQGNRAGDRRTCDGGVAVDEANPGPGGWDVLIPNAFDAAIKIEAGDCEEGVVWAVRDDFQALGVAGMGPLPLSFAGEYQITADLTQENPPGAADEVVIRGTVTVTRTSPVDKVNCGCP